MRPRVRSPAGRLAGGVLLVLMAAATDGDLSVQGSGEEVAPPLADLSWLSGTWVAETPGEYLEEHWGPPLGNSMVGYFRWLRGDSLWITEHLSITQEAGGVYFRLRHFSSRMRAWESDDDPFLYRLVERGTGRLLFEAEEARAGRPLRFIFRSVPGDSLSVRLESEQGGRPEVQEFWYGRAAPP